MKTSLPRSLIAACAVLCAVATTSHSGWIKRHIYSGIPGVNVADLTNNPAFPSTPDGLELIPQMPDFTPQLVESAPNIADTYGSYLPGYLEPPETGLYTFWIAGDDEAQLWLTTDPADPLNPAKRQLICYVPGWSNAREYTKFPEQQSAPIHLEQGKRYYLEVLHKEGGGGDHVGLGWQLPSGVLQRPMASFYLQPTKDNNDPVLVSGPFASPVAPRSEWDFSIYDGMEAMLHANLNLTPPYTVSWKKNGAIIPGANQTYYRFRARTSDSGATFHVTVNGVDYGPLTLSVFPDSLPLELTSATVVPNNPTQVRVVFSKEVTPATATSTANYALNAGTVQSATLSPDGRTVSLGTTLLQPGILHTLTINGIQDWALPANTIAANTTTNLFITDGAITYRSWGFSRPDSLATLRHWSHIGSSAYSYTNNLFTEERIITTTSYQWNLAPARDYFTSQMIGYLTPPETGLYKFAIASDDHSILYLGTTHERSSKMEVCNYNGSTGRWNTGAQLGNQQSAFIWLEAGKSYYFEAVSRDGTGGDGISVFWQTPSGPPLPTANENVQANTEPFLIPAGHLSTYANPPVPGGINFRIWDALPADLATLRNWSNTNSVAPTYTNAMFALERSITTTSYQWSEVPLGNHFMAHIIGYLTAPETGNYKFAIASDDHSILYLGTTDDRATKREVCNYNGATGRWNTGAQVANQQSALIPLEAGKRYYFEAVYRDGTGGDGVSVFWQTPSGLPLPTANENVQANTEPFLIPARFLSTWNTFGEVFFATDLAPALSAAESSRPTLRVAADGTRPYSLQWYRDGVAIPGATTATYTLPFLTTADNGATYHVTLTNLFSAVTSAVTTVSVTADTVKPSVVSVGSLYKQSISIQMSEPVTAASAANAGNYTLLTSSNTVVAVNSAAVDPADASRITLQTAALPETDLMRLVIQNLVDRSAGANVMDPATNTFRANNFDALARINNTQAFRASAAGDSITITAGGTDIWGTADQLVFLYKTITGNFDYRVRGNALAPINAWCKMGPMLRTDVAAGARNNFACFTPYTPGQNTYSAQVRQQLNQATSSSGDAGTPLAASLQPGVVARPPVDYPTWLRLQRVGDQVFYYYSANGTNWTFWTSYDSATSPDGPLPATVQFGLALTSHDTAFTVDGGMSSFSVLEFAPLQFVTTLTNAVVTEGGTASFSATVTGRGPWTFEWSKNGVPITMGNTNVLVLTGVPFSDNGATIALRVTNPYGDVLNASAQLIVLEPDTTPPTVARVGSVFRGVVELYMSEPITSATAGNPANYTLRDSTGANVPIWWVAQNWENPSHITLNTDPMPEHDLMEVRIAGLQDQSLAGNIMVPATNYFRANNFDFLERINNSQNFSASADGERILMTAGGADIWGTSDQFAWLYKNLSGDFDYKVQGISLQQADPWSKMGIMARVSIAANSRNNFTCFTPVSPGQNTYSPQVRPAAGAASTSTPDAGSPLALGLQPGVAARPPVVYPSWLRLQRVGDFIYYYYGPDGTNWTYWTRYDSTTSAEGPLPYDLQVGLALTSHNTSQTSDGVMASFLPVNEGPLRFALQPVSVTVGEGGSTVFTALAEGRRPFTYQWIKNGADIPGANGTALALTGIPLSDNGATFACRIANPHGESLTSTNAILTVVQDTDKPVAYAVGSLHGIGVGVYFSDVNGINPTTAGNPANYTVNGGAVTVTSATVEPDGLAVMLGLSAPISGDFTVSIQGVTDGASTPNTITPVVLGSTVVTWPTSQDIGTLNPTPPPQFSDPLMPGFAQAIGTDGFYVHAGGSDIWNLADGMHFVHQAVAGDFDVSVRVAGLLRPNEWAKAGLMVREELAADSRNLLIAATPTTGQNLITMQWRPTKGVATVSLPDAQRPRPSPIPNAWLRVTRAGQDFAFYYGTNGVDWVLLHTASQASDPYPATVYVGMATTSHDNGATLANVTAAYYRDLDGLVPSPSLQIMVVGANVEISWTTSDPAWQLTATPELEPADWQPVTTPPVVDGNTRTVTVPASALHHYFRLARP